MSEAKWIPRHALAKALTRAANNDGHSVSVLDAESGYSELYEALEARRRWAQNEPNPWGHDCSWCGECCYKMRAMMFTALAHARGEK